jgi:DNA-binding LacI/PurR family transcriptional regulator
MKTSIDQTDEEIGRQSAMLLIDQIEDHSSSSNARPILLKPRVVVRDF